MNNSDSKTIYDFFYLDFERIRSYAAQLFGGITDSLTYDSSINTGVGGKGQLGIPLVGSVNAGVDIKYYKSTSETKSLHHKLYLDVEKELDELQKIQFINENDTEKISTPFVKFTSNLQVLDYQDIGNKLSDIFDLVQVANTLTKTNKPVNIGIKKKELNDMVVMIKRMYGDTVRLHFIKNNSLLTQTALQPGLIQHGFAELVTNQKRVIKNEWITFAQIIKKEDVIEAGQVSKLSISHMDDAIISLLEVFSGLNDLINSKGSLNIIPIAIYRKL